MTKSAILCLLGLVAHNFANPVTEEGRYLHFKELSGVTSDSLHNVHVEYTDREFSGEIHMVYGKCDITGLHQTHSVVGRTNIEAQAKPKRFVWIVPEDAVSGGCLHVFSGSELLGRSNSIEIGSPLKKRQLIADVADSSGPWFDGVAYMKSKNNSAAFVVSEKSKSIGILGGGMAGLMTSLLLQSVGVEDWHILESSQRLGGRVRTVYFDGTAPDQYQYQEMGPMRFPINVTYADTNETLTIQDHQLVFQLVDVLNSMNQNNPSLKINLIPWIQKSANVPADSRGYRLPNGRVPSVSQLSANESLAGPAQTSSNATEADIALQEADKFIGLTRDEVRLLSKNIFKAHKDAIDRGIFHWSESGYMRYALGVSLNVTDFVSGPLSAPSMWSKLYEVNYFAATTWKTIDLGLDSLPRAFAPHVMNRTTFGRVISALTYDSNTDKVSVHWRDAGDEFSLKTSSADFDYVVNTVPFSRVRLWRLPPYSSLLSRAINTMNYIQACKIALKYKTRFWEHLDPPIIGGCGTTDIPGGGSVCYPSYNINGTGPGVLLASYNVGIPARSLAALTVQDHVALAQRAMIEVHGEIAAEQWTGSSDRLCWELDENTAGGWAYPLVGQQDLYLPSYFRTEFKTVFAGEATSYNHGWIFSALESSVRGTTQLLLDMGLVDEAKNITQTWMARWISL